MKGKSQVQIALLKSLGRQHGEDQHNMSHMSNTAKGAPVPGQRDPMDLWQGLGNEGAGEKLTQNSSFGWVE